MIITNLLLLATPTLLQEDRKNVHVSNYVSKIMETPTILQEDPKNFHVSKYVSKK